VQSFVHLFSTLDTRIEHDSEGAGRAGATVSVGPCFRTRTRNPPGPRRCYGRDPSQTQDDLVRSTLPSTRHLREEMPNAARNRLRHVRHLRESSSDSDHVPHGLTSPKVTAGPSGPLRHRPTDWCFLPSPLRLRRGAPTVRNLTVHRHFLQGTPLQPTLLHQLADDRVGEHRRHHQPTDRRPPRPRSGRAVPGRLRMAAGGLLIAASTRVAGSRAGAAGLRRDHSTPA
jgi:hypothetical protein